MRKRVTHQVAFVEEQQHVLVARVLAQVLLQVPAARALRVPGIQHLRPQDHILFGMLQTNCVLNSRVHTLALTPRVQCWAWTTGRKGPANVQVGHSNAAV